MSADPNRGPDATELVNQVDDVAPMAGTPAELLGLTVGRAYGVAILERDQARALVAELGTRLAKAAIFIGELGTQLDAVGPASWANDNVTRDQARAFLADLEAGTAVDSAQSPEQESP